MIGLDTNVLVRFIAQDDVKQAALATKLISGFTRENPGFVSQVSLVELVWVMQSCYEASKTEVLAVLDKILRTQELVVENQEVALQALSAFAATNADYSDCLIACSARNVGCEQTLSFDKNAVKFAGMTLLA